MDQLSSDIIISIALAAVIFSILKFMPQILAWGIPFYSVDAIKERMDKGEDILVIDVRSGSEFIGELGHVPGSLNLDASSLSEKLSELGDKLSPHMAEPVVVTCRTQNRSPRAAKMLKAAGFKDVSILKGGVTEWKKAGHKTERRAK